MSQLEKGKLIILDGADGSGKATQAKLLVKRLKKEGYKVKAIDFPRYYDNFFGAFIGTCLRGDHGNFAELDPYIASVLYAADRFESKNCIEKWIQKGYVVVSDRYVSANQMHQGGKIKDDKEQKKFLKWLDAMEFGVFGLPRPEIIVYLDVPRVISATLLETSEAKKSKHYLKGKADVVENNSTYLDDSRESALKLIEKQNQWVRVRCTQAGVLLSKESISEKIWQNVVKVL